MILVVGLTSAWQRTIEFGAFQLGEVNRATRVTESAGGKGTNCARVATQIGAEARLLTVVGGVRGDLLERSLKQQGIHARVVRVAAETRLCQTLLASGRATELVEEPGALTRSEVEQVLGLFRSQLARASLVVLIGTVPPGCGEDFYARLIREATRVGVRAIVDAQSRLLLNAIAEKPFLVRINRKELAAATRFPARTPSAFLAAARKLVGLGAQTLVISNGSKEVQVFPQGWGFNPPHVNAVNAVGSGDAMTAGLAHALQQGKGMREAIHWGIACGAANAMTPTAGSVRPADVRTLLRRF
jgi:tagatose 6-phosphate kinase